jgi:hypothetical protein
VIKYLSAAFPATPAERALRMSDRELLIANAQHAVVEHIIRAREIKDMETAQ